MNWPNSEEFEIACAERMSDPANGVDAMRELAEIFSDSPAMVALRKSFGAVRAFSRDAIVVHALLIGVEIGIKAERLRVAKCEGVKG